MVEKRVAPLCSLSVREQPLKSVAAVVGWSLRRQRRGRRSSKGALKALERLLRQHEWIATERAMFGRAGSYYDFKARDPVASQALLQEKLDEQSRCGAGFPGYLLCDDQ